MCDATASEASIGKQQVSCSGYRRLGGVPCAAHPAPGDRRWLVVPAAAHPVPQPPRRGGLPCRLSRLLPRWLGPGGTPRPGHNWTGPPRSRSRRCRALGCRAALGARAERAVSGMTKRRIAAASSVSGKRWRLRVACFGHLPRRCGAAQARSLVATRARVVRGRVNADDRLNQRSWQAVVVRPRWRWIRRRRQAIAHGGCWQGVQLQGGGEAREQLRVGIEGERDLSRNGAPGWQSREPVHL